MIRKKKLLIIFITVLPIIGIAVFLYFIPGKSLRFPAKENIIIINHPPRLSDVQPFIQDGDIMLRMSRGHWSQVFCEYSPEDKRFSHCGIVRIRDGKATVIQAMGLFNNPETGVEEIIMDHFTKPASSVGIFRVRKADGSVISDTAYKYIDRPFDFDFDLDDDSKVYCTELLYLALKQAKPALILPTVYAEEIKKDVIPMDSISNNPAIDELAYIVYQRNPAESRENEIILKRGNPVKIGFFQRLLLIFSRIRNPA